MTAAREVMEFIESPDDERAEAAPPLAERSLPLAELSPPLPELSLLLPELVEGSAEATAVLAVLVGIGVHGRDGWAPRELSAVIEPGRVTVLTGPNGSGKSSVLAVLLGLLRPDEGGVWVDPAATPAWLPQHPVVLPGTVRENLEFFGVPEPARLAAACAATGFDAVVAELPDGMDAVLGAGGAGLSAGQRQRLALTRVLAAPAALLLLDEPTAHLDPDSEDAVLAAIAARAADGAAVVMVAHHPEAVGGGDVVVDLAGVADAV